MYSVSFSFYIRLSDSNFANIEEIHYKILFNLNILRSFYHKKVF